MSGIRAALYRGDRDTAARLVAEGAPVDVHDAAALGDLDGLRALLHADADRVHGRSDDGFTPLHLAAFLGGPDATRLLVERGADVTAVSTGAMAVQPLHSAAAAWDVDSCRVLLDAGALVDARQGGGYTALHTAAMHGDDLLVDLLLEAGAEPRVRSDDGLDAAGYAERGGHQDLADRLRRSFSR